MFVTQSMSKKFSILLAVSITILLLLVVVVIVVTGSSCAALRNCDSFKPVCATNKYEHQFFYSQCDMVRENCMTGTKWKRDHFSHCNAATTTQLS
ncbi:uncharacterized protein LOC119601635 isoform X1 [Lucilia sericata]|uniref:uncharacterized protein LOC119601635 isoform X1 n=1 Tax=Lucilia sericata TaxID=13632 RepID=UPI0018A7EB4C|nr:uncharacterized protein LOC119601635 isoform X1 [Lucilia sericata]